MKRIFSRIFIAMIFLIFLGSPFYLLPYYISKPGMAKELAPIVEVEDGFDNRGNFMLTTVRMGKANIYTYLWAKVRKYHEIHPVKAIKREDESDEEYNVRQLYLMDSSKLNAIEVAYKKAGLPVEYKYNGVYVLNVKENMPAERLLEPGDRIFEVDDQSFQSSDDFIHYLGKKKEGDQVKLKYERDGQIHTSFIRLTKIPGDNKRAGIGISLVDDKEIIVKPEVKIDTDDIGGPSAGFMFSLEIYNQLVEEDITKGYEIAGTGTISSDGEVGPIGGIEQKIVAAHKAGADLFFASREGGKKRSNYDLAVKTAKDIQTEMKIVPVDTFDEAIEYLKQLPENKGTAKK